MILGIYGASGQGRETLELARAINKKSNGSVWDKIVFIDDAKELDGMLINKVEVYSFARFRKCFKPDNAKLVIALGEPYLRELKYKQIKDAGYKPATLVHPTVDVPESTKLSEGVIIGANAFISCNVKIGANTLVQQMASVGHDCKVGKNAVISAFAFLGGHVEVKDCAYISIHAAIEQGLSIGAWSIVGMGAVVRENIKKDSVAVGVPAQIIRKNENKKVFR